MEFIFVQSASSYYVSATHTIHLQNFVVANRGGAADKRLDTREICVELFSVTVIKPTRVIITFAQFKLHSILCNPHLPLVLAALLPSLTFLPSLSPQRYVFKLCSRARAWEKVPAAEKLSVLSNSARAPFLLSVEWIEGIRAFIFGMHLQLQKGCLNGRRIQKVA